jgi:hypothetical protein
MEVVEDTRNACLAVNLSCTTLTQRWKLHARTTHRTPSNKPSNSTRTPSHTLQVSEPESAIDPSLLFRIEPNSATVVEEKPSQRHCCTPSRSQATPRVREHDHDNRLLHITLSDLSPETSTDRKSVTDKSNRKKTGRRLIVLLSGRTMADHPILSVFQSYREDFVE